MRRGDFDRTSSKAHVNHDGVADDGDFAIWNEGMFGEFSVQVGVPRVVWVNGNSCISKHGFRTSRGNDDFFV